MGNLLNKASIITTPTGYDTGRLLSMKPTVAFGSELVTESTDNVSGWVDARSNATLSIVDNNIRATHNSGSTMGVSSTGFTCVVGRRYRVQINATRNNTNGSLFARVGEIQDLGTTVVNESTTSDSLSINVFFVATLTTHYAGILATSQGSGDFIQASLITVKEDIGADFNFSRASTATRVNSLQTIENVSINVPRIDYTGGVGHILVEPQSTNGVTYSEDFTQTNRLQNGTITSNDVTSPDGTQNASKFTITGGTPYFSPKHAGFSSGTVYTMSCFVKKGTNRWVRLANVSSSSTGAWFDLDNNVVGTTKAAVISAEITNYGNDWYRISSILTAANPGNNNFLGLSDDDGGTAVDSSNFGNTVYFWGFQIQEQNVLTSYIPTNGSTVTRLAENLNNSGNTDLFNNSEGVLYFEGAALNNDTTYNRKLSINDSTNQNQVSIYFENGSTDKIVARIFANGSTIWSSTNIINVYNFNKFAVKYDSNGAKFFINGSLASSHTGTFTFSSALNQLSFNAGPNNQDELKGKIKCVAVFKEALTDTQLQCLTS